MRKLKIVVKPINPDLIENFKILEGEKRKISSPESVNIFKFPFHKRIIFL